MIEQMLSDNLLIRIFQQPLGWRLWIIWLMIINTMSFLYLGRREGRIIAAVWIANAVTMMGMYWVFGYVRLLGLSHVIWWTPLLVWIIPKIKQGLFDGHFGLWLKVLVVSNFASLLIDYIDVARWVLGDRA